MLAGVSKSDFDSSVATGAAAPGPKHSGRSQAPRAHPRKECIVRKPDDLFRRDLRLRALFDDGIANNRINRHHFHVLLNDLTV